MSEAVLVALIAAAPPTAMAFVAWVQGRRNRVSIRAVDSKMDTGNGVELGPTVHRIDQTVEHIAATQKAQGETMHAQAVLLDRGQERFAMMENQLSNVADNLNDQRIEQEQFVSKVSPLCDWVEQRQREEMD